MSGGESGAATPRLFRDGLLCPGRYPGFYIWAGFAFFKKKDK